MMTIIKHVMILISGPTTCSGTTKSVGSVSDRQFSYIFFDVGSRSGRLLPITCSLAVLIISFKIVGPGVYRQNEKEEKE